MSGRPSECQLGSAGCRTGIHPGRSAMLVTDGSFSGTKDARELGTRRVTPEQYAVLLRHVQPAVEKAMQVAPPLRRQPTRIVASWWLVRPDRAWLRRSGMSTTTPLPSGPGPAHKGSTSVPEAGCRRLSSRPIWSRSTPDTRLVGPLAAEALDARGRRDRTETEGCQLRGCPHAPIRLGEGRRNGVKAGASR